MRNNQDFFDSYAYFLYHSNKRSEMSWYDKLRHPVQIFSENLTRDWQIMEHLYDSFYSMGLLNRRQDR